ncbi:hypothetical protein [Naasia sp.]|uniref:hypothetical protein n=1 Tax=Naasia sp. TaxID=2546198 RepID=UPI00261336B2|nr:hypothetical protein [Naasia sp.]
MPDATTWAAVLDEFELRLGDVRAGRLEPSAVWAAPGPLPQLPPDLAGRAAALLAAQREAIAALEAECGRAADELASVRDPAGPAHERAIYFDATG